MADSFDANNPSKSTATVPFVPPSTSEVTIRTMNSDIELMGRSGGLAGQNMGMVAPHPESIRTTSFASPPAAPQQQASRGMSKRTAGAAVWVGLAVVIGGVLFAIGFYLIPALLK